MKHNSSHDILFLSHYFWPEEMATAELLSGIAFSLSKIGLTVYAIAGHPAYRDRKMRLPRFVTNDGVEVNRVWSTQLDKNNPIGRILNTVSFTVSILFSILFRKNPRIIIAVTNPPLLPWVTWIVSFFKRTPYILIIHDVYPDIAVALNKFSNRSIIAETWRLLNRLSYRRAIKIVALGDCMADVLRSELPPEDANKVVVIPNWSDGQKIQPVPRKNHPFLSELELEKKFVVQYSGNIGLFHEIETIVNSAEILKQDTDIHFLFIGDGGQLTWLKDQILNRGLNNMTLLPFQPKDRLPLTLTACDVSLVTLKDEATGFCVPSKFYGILATGKPVICVANQASEPASKVKQHKCGITVNPGDSQGLSEAIVNLKQDHDAQSKYGIAARAAFEQFYTLDKVSAQYADLLKEVIK